MGLWTQIQQWWVVKNADSKNYAWRQLGKIRRAVREKHGWDLVVVRPLEAEAFKREMHVLIADGDSYSVVRALDMWRLARLEYPEFVTDSDRPDPPVRPW